MNTPTLKTARPSSVDALSQFHLQPRLDEKQENRRDWVRASYLWLLLLLFVGVIGFACYANQYGDWTKAKELLAVILPALTGLLGAGTAFYFKSAN